MSSKLTDKQLEKIYGRRPQGNPLFEPFEFGYRCPRNHKGYDITWSEFNRHIWCKICQLDYLSDICPMQRPGWMTKEDWQAHIDKLPFKPRIIHGVDKTLEELDNPKAKSADTSCPNG